MYAYKYNSKVRKKETQKVKQLEHGCAASN
jgi:hypothetical protein